MLEKIESKEIMTANAAMKKYRTKYFIMIITDVVDRGAAEPYPTIGNAYTV